VSRIRTPKPADPQPVGDLVSRFLEKSGLAPKVEAAGAIADWAERVGPQIAAVTRAMSVNEGTLFVSVATSPWLMELNLMKGELMKRVNAGRKEGKIRQIVFVMAA
jgi:predicted nucleic acid-binding Zn ribbon protein